MSSVHRRPLRQSKPPLGAALLRFSRSMMDPRWHYLVIIVSALGFAALLFSGFLMFRFLDTQDLLQHGKQLLAEGKVARAVEVLDQLVKADPNHYEGHVRLGQAYLELGDKRRAEQEFKVASLLKAEMTAPLPKALIQEALAQGGAQSSLLQEALYDLYTLWGNYLLSKPDAGKKESLQPAIDAFGQAVHYAPSYYLETQAKDKLTLAVGQEIKRLSAKQADSPAVGQLLETLLKYNYSADTLLKLVQWHEARHDTEAAIRWARKAFELSPSSMSLKFSNLLIMRGHELAKEQKPEQAQTFYHEAERIGQLAHLRYDQLFPVAVQQVAIHLEDTDHVTGRFTPDVRLTLANESQRPLDFLAVKVEFYKGDKKLETVTKAVITPSSPLPAKDVPTPSQPTKPKQAASPAASTSRVHIKTVSLAPAKPFYLHQLSHGALTMKVSIAYSEGEEHVWYLKTLRELRIVIPSPQQPAPTTEVEQTDVTPKPVTTGAPTPPVPVTKVPSSKKTVT
jgi:tetratricopeptide (TPR) repeat protein